MRKLKLTTLLNYMMVIYVIVWVYYLIFNWDVFSVRLNIYLGFATLNGFPFIFFLCLGLVPLLIARIYAQIIRVRNERTLEERNHRTRILEKELEITRLRSENNNPDNDWENEITDIKNKIQQLNQKIMNVQERPDESSVKSKGD